MKHLLKMDSTTRKEFVNEVLQLRKKVLGKDFDENEAQDIEDVIQKALKKENTSDSDGDNKSTKGPSQEKINKGIEAWVNMEKEKASHFIQNSVKR